MKSEGRIISWFSCGAASAVASKLAIQEHGEVEVIYQETHSEHPDNERFLVDCGIMCETEYDAVDGYLK